jgi:hypothetical protein
MIGSDALRPQVFQVQSPFKISCYYLCLEATPSEPDNRWFVKKYYQNTIFFPERTAKNKLKSKISEINKRKVRNIQKAFLAYSQYAYVRALSVRPSVCLS